jgi:holo-[acyl-carrier protein] synthase
MLRGVGVDLTHVSRFERIVARYGERFTRRFLSAEEARACASSATPLRFMASRWAAKEALVKALGGVVGTGSLPFAGVQVESDGEQPPRFRAVTESWQRALADITVMLSISHDQDAAVAMVVAASKS